MKQKFPTIFTLFLILLASACGPAPEPTLSAADVQGTAVANAWIALTQTQAAIPTSTFTPVPPETPTLPPSATPNFIQSLIPPTVAVVAATPTTQCNQVPPLIPKGQLINVEFKNDSGGSANFSFGMNSANKFGECVTYSYSLGKFDTLPAKVLLGCYWGYAWITGDNDTSTAQGTQLMCLNDPNVTYHVLIGKETIALK